MAADLESLLGALVGGDDTRAEAAVPEIAALGRTALPSLEDLLCSADGDVRWWALRTLAQMPAPPVAWLIEALTDPSAEVRQCAALGLSHHPAEEAIPTLIRLLSDPDTMTANLAANALISIGTPAVPDLLASIEGISLAARVETVRALACIADHRAIPALMAAFEADSLSMKFWAEEGLERLGLGMVYFKVD